jgi:hypothetical protein
MHPVVMALLRGNSKFVMRISTSTTGTNTCHFTKGTVDSSKVSVLEFETKVETSGSTVSQIAAIRNGTKSAFLGLCAGSIICNFQGTSPYTYNVDTSVLHVYMIKLNGTTNCEFYIDGVLIHTATYANLYSSTANYFNFGDTSSTAGYGGSVVWGAVKYNTDYGADPNNFVVCDPSSKPNEQGWTLGGTDLATIIEE